MRYAALGHLIDTLIQSTYDHAATSPGDLLTMPTQERGGFQQLSEDAVRAMRQELPSLRVTTLFAQTAELTDAVRRVEPWRHTELDEQFKAGINTAIRVKTKVLASLPSLIEYYAPDQAADPIPPIARSSVGMPWNLAMMCINQLGAAQSLLAPKVDPSMWKHVTPPIKPEFVEPLWQQDRLSALQLRNLSGTIVPEGHMIHMWSPAVATDTELSDIACDDDKTIGCPITLAPKKLHLLWELLIRAAEQRQLWPQS